MRIEKLAFPIGMVIVAFLFLGLAYQIDSARFPEIKALFNVIAIAILFGAAVVAGYKSTPR